MDKASDQWAILTLAARLAQAADDRDEVAYRACLAGRVFSGSPEESRSVSAGLYAREAIARAARADWTHHKLANPVIEIHDDGNHASARIDVVVDLMRTDDRGVRHRLTLGGRYVLGLVRLDGAWRIECRAIHRRYVDGDPGGFVA
jgi:hypothetical protein